MSDALESMPYSFLYLPSGLLRQCNKKQLYDYAVSANQEIDYLHRMDNGGYIAEIKSLQRQVNRLNSLLYDSERYNEELEDRIREKALELLQDVVLNTINELDGDSTQEE